MIEIGEEHRSGAPISADATGHSPGIQAAAAQRLSVTRGRDTSAVEPEKTSAPMTWRVLFCAQLRAEVVDETFFEDVCFIRRLHEVGSD